jgi:hypothetical protein
VTIDTVETPAHHRLSAHLNREVAWDTEFEADLDDLVRLVEAWIPPEPGRLVGI